MAPGATFLVLAWISVTLLSRANGSRVQISSSPQSMSHLTETLVLRCSLHDTAALGGPVGRRQADSHQVSSLVNVQQVSSVLVTLGGRDVASLITGSRPLKLNNATNLGVSGSLTPSGDEVAHLMLTWTQPSSGQAGEYTCKINGIDGVGHNVKLSVPVQVAYGPPSMDDLVNYVVDMKAKVSDLEARLIQSQHIESGTLWCGQSTYWPGRDGSYFIYKDLRQGFQREYTKPPRVMLHVIELHDNNQYSVWAVYLRNVDLAGFDVRCQTWVNYLFKTLTVTWISIPDTD